MKMNIFFTFAIGASAALTSSAQARIILNDPLRERIVVTIKQNIKIDQGITNLFFVGNKILQDSDSSIGMDEKVMAQFGKEAKADKKINPNIGGFNTPATFCWVRLNSTNTRLIPKGTQFTSEGDWAIQEYAGQTLWMWTNGFMLACQNVATVESKAALREFDISAPTHNLTAKNLSKHIGAYFDFQVIYRKYKH